MIQKKTYNGWRKRVSIWIFYEWLHRIQKFCSSYFLSDVYQTQSFSLYKKTICELHSEKFLHSMNIYYCALSHYLKRHVTNKQLNIMHFCWRSLDDKSLSSLLESCTKKCISYACLYKYCKHYRSESLWLWLWHDLFWYKILIFYWRWRKYFSAFKT